MALPSDLQRLLPQALDVLRFLDAQPGQGASMSAMLAATGLSERALGRAIRRLVTQQYVNMPAHAFYALTAAGRQAARDLRLRAEEPAVDPAAAVTIRSDDLTALLDHTVPASLGRLGDNTPLAGEHRHARRLTVLRPPELVLQRVTTLKVGLDAAAPGEPALRIPGRVVLRLTATECLVDPRDRPLAMTAVAAGPVRFSVTPRRAGSHHLTFEVFQLLAPDDLRRIGGMYCDLDAVTIPSPHHAAPKTLGALMSFFTG